VNQGRFYPYGGRLYPSVTTVLRAKFPGPVAEDEAQQAEWNLKRDRGSEVHRLIARGAVTDAEWVALSLNPAEPPTEEKDYSPTQKALAAWRRFTWEYCYKAEQVEEELVNADLGYGGKPDSIGRIPKGRVLVDWKTGRLHREYVRYQLGAYWGLYAARYPRRRIFGALGVHLDCDDGSYEVEAMAASDLSHWFASFIELKEEVVGHSDSAS
jgi:hypothetical protein